MKNVLLVILLPFVFASCSHKVTGEVMEEGTILWAGEPTPYEGLEKANDTALKEWGSQDVSPSALAGTKWKLINSEEKDTLEFKENVYFDTSYRVTCEYPYVISSQYQRSGGKINTPKGNGCYINYYNDKVDETDYYIIVSYTPKKLTLLHLRVYGNIGGGDWSGEYKRIK